MSGGRSSYLFIVVCECHVPKGCLRRYMKEVRGKLLRYLLHARSNVTVTQAKEDF